MPLENLVEENYKCRLPVVLFQLEQKTGVDAVHWLQLHFESHHFINMNTQLQQSGQDSAVKFDKGWIIMIRWLGKECALSSHKKLNMKLYKIK